MPAQTTRALTDEAVQGKFVRLEEYSFLYGRVRFTRASRHGSSGAT